MSAEIHQTAIIAPGAEIGPDCVIGPYSVVGPNVRLGAGTRLHEHVVVDGHTTLGTECEVFSFACVGKQTQDLKYKNEVSYVEIGDRTTLREYVTVNAATAEGARTVVGNDCHILAYSHIAHECRLGSGIIMSNGTQLAGHVEIEDHVVFGGLGGVHQFVRIGRMSMISATAKVVQDIVPYCLADGNPALPATVNRIGLQRHGASNDTIRAVGRAYKILFRGNLKLEDALAQLRETFPDCAEVQHMTEFAASSERGLARPKSAKS